MLGEGNKKNCDDPSDFCDFNATCRKLSIIEENVMDASD